MLSIQNEAFLISSRCFPILAERVAELEATVQSLEQQMQDQEEEANNVISQWQESCTASDDMCSELKKELEEVRKDKESLDKALESGGSVQVVESPPTNEGELLKKLSDTQEELKIAKETLSRDEVVVHQWEGTFIQSSLWRTIRQNGQLIYFFFKFSLSERVAEQETAMQSLESQLQEQEKEANNVILQWQESCSASDEKSLELEKELEKVKEEKESLEKALEVVENDNEQLEELKVSLKAKIVSLEEAIDEESGVEAVKGDYIERLLAKLRETEEELRVANETLARDEDVVRQWEGKLLLEMST